MAVDISRYELRLAREQRRLAKIELQKAEVAGLAADPDALAAVAMARVIATRIVAGLIGILLVVVPLNVIAGMHKRAENAHMLTACVKYFSEHQVQGRCRLDGYGHPTMDLNKTVQTPVVEVAPTITQRDLH